MAKKYLYGNLNQDTVRPNYGGSTSDSVTIHVDNDNMVISGEVNWDAALGELAHKAYPGDKGARNYQKILELTARIDEEIASATASRDDVTSKVAILEKSFAALNEQLVTAVKNETSARIDGDNLSIDRCKAEAERALTAEKELLTKLSEEQKSRADVDAEIIHRLDQLSGLSSTSLEEVRQLIIDESVRATTSEQAIVDKLVAEETRALNAESVLSSKIDTIDAVHKEVLNKISTAVKEEESARILDTQLLTEVISNEVDRATTVEESIISDVSKVETAIDALDDVVKELYSVVTSLKTSDNDVESRLVVIENDLVDLETSTTTKLADFEKDISAIETLHTADIKRIDKEITSVEKSVSSNVNLISKLTTKLNETTKHLTAVDTSIRSIQASVVSESTERKTSDATLDKKLAAVEKTLTQKDTELLTNIQTVNDKTVDLTSSLQVVQGTVKTLSTQVAELYAADVVTEDEFNLLNEQLKTVYNNIGELSSAIQAEVTRSTNKDDELSVALQSIDANYSLIDSRLAALSKTIEALTVVTETLDKKVQDLGSSYTLISDRVSQLEDIIADNQQHIENETTARVDADNEIKDNLAVMQESIESFQPQIDAAVSSVESVKSDIAEIESQLIQSNENIAALAEVIDLTVDRLSGVQDELDNTTDRIDGTLEEHKTALVKHDVDNHRQDVEIEDLKKSIEVLTDVDKATEYKIKVVEEQATADRDLHQSHYKQLVSRIEQEIKRAVAADASLLKDTDRNSGRITALQLELTNVISAYVDELRTTDSQLNEKIDNERIHNEESTQKLTQLIEDVEQDSIQRDNALQAQIEIITGKKDSVPLMENDGDMPEVYAQQGDKTFTIPTEKAVVPEAIVRRDSVGNILLSTDDDSFTAYSAVSKLFVENVVSELRKEISSISFDFIDGGNAPIG